MKCINPLHSLVMVEAGLESFDEGVALLSRPYEPLGRHPP